MKAQKAIIEVKVQSLLLGQRPFSFFEFLPKISYACSFLSNITFTSPDCPETYFAHWIAMLKGLLPEILFLRSAP